MAENDIGPVTHIRMQEPWRPDCTNCGRAVDVDKVVYTRHTSSNGLTGNAPWCPKCYRRWNPEDTDERKEAGVG